MKFLKIYPLFFFFWALLVVACTQDDDGSIGISNSTEVYGGKGYFLAAELDSGSLIHLADDTLFIGLDSIWSFSNCALSEIYFDIQVQESVLELRPVIYFQSYQVFCRKENNRGDFPN